MNKLIKIAIITILTFNLNLLYAHGGHGKGVRVEVSKTDIKHNAIEEIKSLVKIKKIDKSWLNATLSKVEKKRFKYGLEWVVTFKNKKIKDIKKQTIYVFMSIFGKTTGVNYTGK